jgi:hypothetical protein
MYTKRQAYRMSAAADLLDKTDMHPEWRSRKPGMTHGGNSAARGQPNAPTFLAEQQMEPTEF